MPRFFESSFVKLLFLDGKIRIVFDAAKSLTDFKKCLPSEMETASDIACAHADRVILKGKEGFGVLGNCLSVLGETIGLELLEEMLDWAISAIQKSTVWEVKS